MARPRGDMASPLGEAASGRSRDPEDRRQPSGRSYARASGGRGSRTAGRARPGGWWALLRRAIGPLVLFVISGAAVVLLLSGLQGATEVPPEGTPRPSAHVVAGGATPTPAAPPETASPTPLASPVASPVASLPIPTPTSEPVETPPPTPAPTPPPATDRPPGAAPADATEFEATEPVVIDIVFPFEAGVRYRYRDNWLQRRAGAPEHYNHVRGPRRGELLRAHDGTDIYAPLNTPVRAPFAGLVIDPAERWQPWHPERHGEAVVIVSQEPLSEGYVALLSHLEMAFVRPGDVIRRGEVIGLAGNTGNAEGGPVHVHFELRAPFLLEWDEAGETRLVDAFNPYPSLRAADPATAD
jgi:murein DD-endopeptidase MepM/ murein hydrolase activator NlpD